MSDAVEDRDPDKIYAPWLPATVAALNHYQASGRFHPFTCPGNHQGEMKLVAHEQGWSCASEHCTYAQDWAWRFMTEGDHGDR
jgi:hypothetical protein